MVKIRLGVSQRFNVRCERNKIGFENFYGIFGWLNYLSNKPVVSKKSFKISWRERIRKSETLKMVEVRILWVCERDEKEDLFTFFH